MVGSRRNLAGPLQVLLTVLASVSSAVLVQADDSVSFNRDIRPILSDRCFLCHGPDESSREAGFRLDLRESAIAEADSGEFPIVPGDPAASELMRRIASDDPSELMPPAEAHKSRLSDEEAEKFRLWIKHGARYQIHWSLIPPERPPIQPDVVADQSTNPIDWLIEKRLQENGLAFSPAANKNTLIRRVTLDLTGLPPTPAEIEAFLADDRPDAWERLVDRLLASERYGEHMARYWLDAVRYGDTHGLHLDNYREVWPYRDWVISAFNQNMRWDEFTINQLAGDLLPNPTQEDLIASGFNRLHITTNEGGTIPEEARVRNVIDRVETVGTVYLGMTVGCAVCHDHKFDPVSAKEFYSLFAFFNNLDANPMDANDKAHAPVIQVPADEQKKNLANLETRIEDLRQSLDAPNPELDQAQQDWETEWSGRLGSTWTIAEPSQITATENVELNEVESGLIQASGPNPDKSVYELTTTTNQIVAAIRLKAFVDPESVQQSNGRSENGNAVLSEIEIGIRPANSANDQPFEPVRLALAQADHSQNQFPISAAIDGKIDDATGWATEGYARKEERLAVFVPQSPFGFDTGTEIRIRLHFVSHYSRHSFGRFQVALSSEGAIWPVTWSDWNLIGPFPSADGQKAYHAEFGPEKNTDLGKNYGNEQLAWAPAADLVDGQVYLLQGGEIGAWYFQRQVFSPSQRTTKISLGSDDAVRVWLNGQSVFENNVARSVTPDQDQTELQLKPGLNHLLVKVINFGGAAGFYFQPRPADPPAPGLALMQVLEAPAGSRTPEQRSLLKEYFRANFSADWKAMKAGLDATITERDALIASFPTTLIMKELSEPRPAYLLKRGQYDQPDTENGPLPVDVPGVLPRLPEGAPANRLGLAEWLIDPGHPLMARVTVNRFWQQLFGRGIVATSEDFGSQGSWPSHPELLDWLAVEFRETDWDVKRLMKTMLMSRTYRQSSRVTPESVTADPDNGLLSRGPRFRLDAETLRDQALALSGLLFNKMGGPGVKPPQPAGIWKSVAYVGSNTDTFSKDSGPDKVHRRSIYTFWKRTAPPPQMETFDAPSRESCTVRRERTNTPLQALLMLNDPQYIEAARHLAGRTMLLPDTDPETRARWMMSLATCRPPTSAEVRELVTVFDDRRDWYRNHPDDARQLVSVGESPPDDEHLSIEELAAWTLVANVVLNLDEVISRE